MIFKKKHKVARVKDIATTRGVTRSSVSTVLNLLKKKDLIKHESYGLVELTEEGEALGRALDMRHETIKKFFIEILGISTDIADSDACKMEHHISSETLDCLTRFLTFVESYPSINDDYLKQFKREHKPHAAKGDGIDDVE